MAETSVNEFGDHIVDIFFPDSTTRAMRLYRLKQQEKGTVWLGRGGSGSCVYIQELRDALDTLEAGIPFEFPTKQGALIRGTYLTGSHRMLFVRMQGGMWTPVEGTRLFTPTELRETYGKFEVLFEGVDNG